jgi:hypothetical protein
MYPLTMQPFFANPRGAQNHAERQANLHEFERNIRMANALTSTRNWIKKPNLEQAKTQFRLLQKRRAAMNSKAPPRRSLADCRRELQRIENTKFERDQQEHKFDHLFPELRATPCAAADELRAPAVRQRPPQFLGWNIGPDFTGRIISI